MIKYLKMPKEQFDLYKEMFKVNKWVKLSENDSVVFVTHYKVTNIKTAILKTDLKSI